MSGAHIVTTTLNPAIDQTVELENLVLGAVNRGASVTHNAGGKGVNVASCLADWGLEASVTGFLGRGNRAVFENLFSAKPLLTNRFYMVEGATRDNIKLVARDTGDTTDVNLPGFSVQAQELESFTEFVTRDVFQQQRQGSKVAVFAGSVPTGLEENAWHSLLQAAKQAGYYVVLDASGDPLKSVLSASKVPTPQVLKPNRHELEEWAGRSLQTQNDLLSAARELLDSGAELVVVSMGSEGALFVTAEEALIASPPSVVVGSSVGAGDAMVAGIVSGLVEKLALPELAKRATGFAAAKLAHIGPHLPNKNKVTTLAAATQVKSII